MRKFFKEIKKVPKYIRGDYPIIMVALDNYITSEENMIDDYVGYSNGYAFIAVPTITENSYITYENAIKSVKHREIETTFKRSGATEKRVTNLTNSLKFDIYFWKLNREDIIYKTRSDGRTFSFYDIQSPTEKEQWVNERLEENDKLNATINEMKTNTYYQQKNIYTENIVDKYVRYFNQTLNKHVRNNKVFESQRFAPDKYGDIKYLFGASSPKRNVLHALTSLNNTEVIEAVLEQGYEELYNIIEKKKEVEEAEKIYFLKVNKKDVSGNCTLASYNYYEDKLNIFFKGVYITLETFSSFWYDEYEKGDVISASDLYQYTILKKIL